jgi:peptide/nickel transport system permease protein
MTAVDLATSHRRSPAWRRLADAIRDNFWVQRLARMVLIVTVVVTLTFFILRALPGNPVDILTLQFMEQGLSADEALARVTALYRIDLSEPLWSQYLSFMANLVRGDLGDSLVLANGEPVAAIVAQRLPWTLFSVGLSLLISFALGMFLGMLAAYRRNSPLDYALTNLGAVLDAIPNTLTAIYLVFLLGVVWQVIPLQMMRGSISPGMQPGFTLVFFADVLAHVAVPATIYVLSTLGGWILAMRASTISALGEDYLTVARARGLPDLRILTAYVGRNASLPLVTGFSIALGFAVGGSVLIEQIFNYQGIGLLLTQALNRRDYPVLQGILLVTTIAVLISTSLADLLYGWLDPRIRTGGEA